jgi:hypothetical protein
MNQKLYAGLGKQLGGDWREAIKALKEAETESNEYAGMMTEYEKSAIMRDIKAQREAIYPMVKAGVLEQHDKAIKKIEDAKRKYNQEQTNEIRRWDASRLSAELDVAQRRAEMALAAGDPSPFQTSPTKGARLEALFTEALQSDDDYKKRSAFEVIRAISPKVTGDERAQVNHLSKLAEQELSNLRITEGMVAAQAEQATAWNEYLQTRDEVIDASKALGDDPLHVFSTNDFARAIRRVQVDRDSGEVVIYPADAPEVSGVFIRTVESDKKTITAETKNP